MNNHSLFHLSLSSYLLDTTLVGNALKMARSDVFYTHISLCRSMNGKWHPLLEAGMG